MLEYYYMSQNSCTINITQGKNKGKMCGEVNKKCRHKPATCEFCNRVFKRDTSYFNHIKTCSPNISVKIHELEIAIAKLSSQSLINTQVIKEQIAKIKPTIEERIAQLPPSVTNNIQIVINDAGVFKSLCDNMGVGDATSFLCELACKPKIMTLFEKVYLEGPPSEYPIANNNGKDFYYHDSDNNLICDIGGKNITRLGERLMQNTFLQAADPLLKRFVSQNDGDHEGDDDDYDRFRELQNGACKCKSDKTFTNDLYKKTYNPGHMFFHGDLF